jgi:hypothetical protein
VGERAPWLNCGTLFALAGFAVFVLFGAVLVQMLCHGPGGMGEGSLKHLGR